MIRTAVPGLRWKRGDTALLPSPPPLPDGWKTPERSPTYDLSDCPIDLGHDAIWFVGHDSLDVGEICCTANEFRQIADWMDLKLAAKEPAMAKKGKGSKKC